MISGIRTAPVPTSMLLPPCTAHVGKARVAGSCLSG